MGGANGGGPDNIYFPGAFLAYLLHNYLNLFICMDVA